MLCVPTNLIAIGRKLQVHAFSFFQTLHVIEESVLFLCTNLSCVAALKKVELRALLWQLKL